MSGCAATQPAPATRPARRGRRLKLSGTAAAIIALWLAGLVWFAVTIPSEVADPDSTTDAVIVLTGGSQRLDAGLDLLAAGKARTLFVSGVHQGVTLADLLRLTRPVPPAVACCIVLGHDADSTLGNALETAAWMRREGYGSLRLVTASYHMRRSLFEFGRVMPDIRMIAHPVFPERVRLAHWWESPGTAALIVGEYHKYIGARLRALIAPAAGTLEAAGGAGPI